MSSTSRPLSSVPTGLSAGPRPSTGPSTGPSSTTTSPAVETTPDRSARATRTEEITEELAHGVSSDADAGLRDELVTLNMPVAASIAARYRSRGIAADDLQQVAYLALTKAAQRFDPRAGFAFLAFCVPTIRGEVRRHFRDFGWMVRPPRRIQELQANLMRARTTLAHDLGRPPTEAELATHLDESLANVLEALDAQGCFVPASLDRPVGDDESGTTVGELIGVDDVRESSVEARVALGPVVRRLSDRDRHILRLRFFEGLTQREIAEDIGVTQMQVSRLLTRIYRDLRAGLGAIDDTVRRLTPSA